MLLFTIYVNDEYTAKKMELTCKKLSKKLRNKTEMRTFRNRGWVLTKKEKTNQK